MLQSSRREVSLRSAAVASTTTIQPNPIGTLDSGKRSRLNRVDDRSNRVLKWLAFTGGVVVFVALIAIVYQVISGANMAFSKYGIAFVGHTVWIPAANEFGAWSFIYGTLVTGIGSVFLATILGVSIGLFLSMMAPRSVAAVVGPLVEMLAAIPSVVIGLIGIYLICPFLVQHVEPALHAVLGWIPLFGEPGTVGNSLFAAIVVLTIMVVPIIAALTRDLFLTVPLELRDGAEALGCTRWEMIRGVVLPTTQSGIVAACVLGFGRAIGEAIAVEQVVGGVSAWPVNLFQAGDTSAAVIAAQVGSPVSLMHTSALFYLALILLILGMLTNLSAQWISRRFGARMS
jgi:phosphate transport system permease protein